MHKVFEVATYITAYEDQASLENCIRSILQQSYPVNQIFIIDNSKIKINTSFSKSSEVIINHHPENIGVAKGLSIAIQWAIDRQYDFLWTFDQDSEALPETLHCLIQSYQYLSKKQVPVGILSPKVVDLQSGSEINGLRFNGYCFYHEMDSIYQLDNQNIYEYDVTITSGSLINLKLAKYIDLPDSRLFIDAVDFDYCMKFRKKDYKVFIDKKAILNHNFGTYICHKSIINFHIPIYSYSALRYYYMIRNHTWLELKLSKTLHFKIACIIYRFFKLFKICIKIIFYESPPKLIKIYACIKGLWDGLTGSLQKRWNN